MFGRGDGLVVGLCICRRLVAIHGRRHHTAIADRTKVRLGTGAGTSTPTTFGSADTDSLANYQYIGQVISVSINQLFLNYSASQSANQSVN